MRLTSLVLLAFPLVSLDASRWTLHQDGSAAWIVDPAGEPFPVIGINHGYDLAREAGERFVSEQFEGDLAATARHLTSYLAELGFNNAGYDPFSELADEMPHFANMPLTRIAHWTPRDQVHFPDVWDPHELAKIEADLERQISNHSDHPGLIGYFWNDVPNWRIDLARERFGTDWVSAIRSLPASAPGKQQYAQFLSDRYTETPKAFQRAYNLSSTNSSSIARENFADVDLSDRLVIADDLAFLAVIARQYYGFVAETHRKYDPDRLIFGDRLQINNYTDEVLIALAEHVDAIAIQPDGKQFEKHEFARIHNLTGKPIIVCDHAVAFRTEEHSHTDWQNVEDAGAAGEIYEDYVTALFRRPYMLGYLRCQIIDYVRPSGQVKQGILETDGDPHWVLNGYIAKANRDARWLFSRRLPNAE